MEHYSTPFEYITTQENAWKTNRIPLTNSKDWNMYEHIQRCKNVSNGWFNQGANDGMRPYDDIVTPVIDVAFRTEGFDVKHIVPYVDNIHEAYKSFIIKKIHPQWTRKNRLDELIDEVVESSIIYDLVLIKKNSKERKPEVVPLETLAFCDQTDILSAPICIKHYYSIDEMKGMEGTWENVDLAISLASTSKKVKIANDQEVTTPGKNIEVYELRGTLPTVWLTNNVEDLNKYSPQLQVVCFYTDKEGNKNGITLFKGKDKKIKDNFKALKIDKVRSIGRACGRSIVERLFEPQVWNNYSAIKLKELLDSAFNVIVTDSGELQNQNLKGLKPNTILKQSKGDTTTRLTSDISHTQSFIQTQDRQAQKSRILGSASEMSLGSSPTSGTPFATVDAIIQQGEGIHEYRQGKIASFFADELYQDWILKWLSEDLKDIDTFSEELSLTELMEIADTVAENRAFNEVKRKILEGNIMTEEDRKSLVELYRSGFIKSGSRKFFTELKGELDTIPIKVKVNIAGKQKFMAQNADKLSRLISNVLVNPQAFAQIPGLANLYNELLENSGMSPIDFTPVIKGTVESQVQAKQIKSPVGGEELQEEVT